MANGWTPERRARQAALIKTWKPWQKSTGPKTEEGKAASASNSTKHGMRSREWLETTKLLNDYLRQCREWKEK